MQNMVNNLELFKRQFLLTRHRGFELPWIKKMLSDYHLYIHPDLEFEYISKEKKSIYLLGFIFDYEHPAYTNLQILKNLIKHDLFKDFLKHLAHYSGHFVIIYNNEKELYIFSDAVGQQEIYYDLTFSTFGSQPKLLERVIHLEHHTDPDSLEFYTSSFFQSKKVFIGDTTHLKNVFHLLPNHLIDIHNRKVSRYYPQEAIEEINIEEAASKAITMIQGFLKAASLRRNLAIGVTAGYDSRVLFLASQELKCKYYITKLRNMNDKHHDYVVAKKLAKSYRKDLLVIEDNVDLDGNLKQILDLSIDFPYYSVKQDEISDHYIINGNISEIARNDYLYYKKISPEELAILNRNSPCKLARDRFQVWLSESSEFLGKLGYNVLDMFYWEERMGHWVAKGKTEMSALGVIVYSPFCSQELLSVLLSTPRKYRDYYHNVLYNMIIRKLNYEKNNIPINPYFKNYVKKILRYLGILYIYKRIMLKRKVLSVFGKKPERYFNT